MTRASYGHLTKERWENVIDESAKVFLVNQLLLRWYAASISS